MIFTNSHITIDEPSELDCYPSDKDGYTYDLAISNNSIRIEIDYLTLNQLKRLRDQLDDIFN